MAANTIPFEILRQIFSYLPLTDLPNIALVSPHWYRPAQEALYRAPHLFPVSLMHFLRTLLTPGLDTLATHVRTLSITWQSFIPEPIDAADLPRFDAAAIEHYLPHSRGMTSDCVGLLLYLLPRVQVLHLCPPDSRSGDNDFLEIPQPSVRLPLALYNLRELSCTWISNHRGVSTVMFAKLLSLPNLRTLEVQLIDAPHDSDTDIDLAVLFPLRSSAVTTLHISYWRLVTGALARVLAVPRGLKHLSIGLSTSAIGLPEFYSAVAPLKPTLQVLEVQHVRGSRSWDAYQGYVSPPAESFHDWPALRALRCPLRLLLGDCGAPGARHLWQVVPGALCEVAVATDTSWGSGETVEEFGELVWRKLHFGEVPRLVRGTVELDRRDEVVVWGKIRELFDSAGVELLVGGFEFVGADGGKSLRRTN